MSRQLTNLERTSRRAVVAAGFSGLLLIGLLFLVGWQLVAQERAIEQQQTLQFLESQSNLIVADLKTKEAEVWAQLAELEAAQANTWDRIFYGAEPHPKDHLLVIHSEESGWEAEPRLNVLYWPETQPDKIDEEVFRSGEFLEFRYQNLPEALATYQRLAERGEPATRIGALFRMARCWRKMERPEKARELYDRIVSAEMIPIRGVPSPLLAQESLIELSKAERSESAEASRELLQMLVEKGWPISRSDYEYFSDRAFEYLDGGFDAPGPHQSQILLSEAFSRIWDLIPLRKETGERRGTAVHQIGQQLVIEMFLVQEDRSVSLLLGPESFQRVFRRGLFLHATKGAAKLVLTDSQGRSLFGTMGTGQGAQVVRSPAATGLDWTMHLFAPNPGDLSRQFQNRRRLLALGALVVMIAVLASSTVAFQALRKQVRVARLQSDFVAAVSHEFRSPLTSIRQMTELLATGRTGSEQRRRLYYDVIDNESRRLSKLVETLLDLNRMEAGDYRYRREPIELGGFLDEILEDFASQRHEKLRISWQRPKSPISVQGDREALALAIWNLLENAYKYSPDNPKVEIELRSEANHAVIQIQDNGLGIHPGELKGLSEKFVRGEAARQTGEKGTGIGLALVDEILRAHQTELEISSQPGKGTRVVICLPRSRACPKS